MKDDIYLKDTHGIIDVSVIYNKPGIIAKLARKLHHRYPKKWLFDLGYGVLEHDDHKTPFGTVIEVRDGITVIEVKGLGHDPELAKKIDSKYKVKS